jgi:hypothetical protein
MTMGVGALKCYVDRTASGLLGNAFMGPALVSMYT